LLSIRQLQSQRSDLPPAPPVDLDVAAGECVAILGPSGSGKSVLLRLIADLDPGIGSITLDGRARESWPAPEWRARVTYQAAESAWWAPDVLSHFPPSERDELRALLPSLGLSEPVLSTEVSRLSTGERQRLALIRTLCRQPAVALLDEPTASLDQASTLAVEAVLRGRLAAGLAIVMVTHSPEQASRLATRIFHMQAGQLTADTLP
jgi:ABC-type iron transport system FetAB ATPase subunit